MDQEQSAVQCRYGVFSRPTEGLGGLARALCDAFHRQRRAAALELAIRQPNKPYSRCAPAADCNGNS